MSTMEQAKTTPARTPERAPDAGHGWLANTRTFFTEVRNEMRRVTWPSRKEVYATTVIVILTSALFGVYLWGVDLALDRLLQWIYRNAGV